MVVHVWWLFAFSYVLEEFLVISLYLLATSSPATLMIHSISFFALIFWAPIFLHPKAVITVNNSLHQGFIIISIKIKEAIEIGEILKSWNKVRILN